MEEYKLFPYPMLSIIYDSFRLLKSDAMNAPEPMRSTLLRMIDHYNSDPVLTQLNPKPMKTISQELIVLPSFENRTVRTQGDYLSVYDLLRGLGLKHPAHSLKMVLKHCPTANAFIEGTLFICNQEQTQVVRRQDWVELSAHIQDVIPDITTEKLAKLSTDLGLVTIANMQVLPPSNATPPRLVSENGKLIFPELDGAEIRSDGELFSVYDFIKIVGQQKDPYNVWTRLSGGFPDVLTNCRNLKFPGRGQRETPVSNREGLIQITQLLPGAVGAKFRAEAAKIILRYLDADITLADDIVDNAMLKGKVADVEKHSARTQGIVARNKLTSTAAKHGLTGGEAYRQLTGLVYKHLTGKTPKQLRKEFDLGKHQIIRDHFGTEWLITLSFLEMAIAKALEAQEAKGNEEVLAIADNITAQLIQYVA